VTTVRLSRVAPAGEEHALLQYFFMCGVWAQWAVTRLSLGAHVHQLSELDIATIPMHG
jgi:hypothetical protein